MAPTGAKKAEPKSTGEIAGDLWKLVREYAKQETIDPLKSIGRFLAWGIGGGLVLALGILFGLLALLRGLQTETGEHLTGSWTWVPYLVTLVVAIGAAALAARAITKPNRQDAKARA